MNKESSPSLKTVLILDSLTCVLCGLLLTLARAPLSAWTDLPPALLGYSGASLFPIAAFMLFVAYRALDSAFAVGVVVAGNVAWTIASLGLIVSASVPMNAVGVGFVLAQALVVATLTWLELRSSGALVRTSQVRGAQLR